MIPQPIPAGTTTRWSARRSRSRSSWRPWPSWSGRYAEARSADATGDGGDDEDDGGDSAGDDRSLGLQSRPTTGDGGVDE